MRFMMKAGTYFLAGMLITVNVSADEYNYEIKLAFDSARFDNSSTTITPDGSIFNSSNRDTDNLSLSGSWYFNSLSDELGPRSRAAFVGRASSVNVAYSSIDQSSSSFSRVDDPTSPVQPYEGTVSAGGDSLSIDLRYVDRDSGWFGTAGLENSDTGPTGLVYESVDAIGWRLGVGKYLFDNTALSFSAGPTEFDGGLDVMEVAADFVHIGNLGERWQYAVDLGYSNLDVDGWDSIVTWRAAATLYPSRNIEFGIGVEDISTSNVFIDATGIEGFASWFVTANLRLTGYYRENGVDDFEFFSSSLVDPGAVTGSIDRRSFGVSATVRF